MAGVERGAREALERLARARRRVGALEPRVGTGDGRLAEEVCQELVAVVVEVGAVAGVAAADPGPITAEEVAERSPAPPTRGVEVVVRGGR